MNKQEIDKLIQTTSLCYPDWYEKLSADDKNTQVEIYQQKFATDEFDVVNQALLELVDECELAPTMYEIRSRITKVRQSKQIKKELDYSRMRNIEPSKKHFKKLSKEVRQKFLNNIKNQLGIDMEESRQESQTVEDVHNQADECGEDVIVENIIHSEGNVR
ncbi:hypothetical protein [Francisella philomiragia]|uniref:hypothetical protein n=1 Tax=Francisella philomiragia TaxID=28110 RepID=UPI002243BDD9|nr:hypothetical protein [Francisella philomiragia]